MKEARSQEGDLRTNVDEGYDEVSKGSQEGYVIAYMKTWWWWRGSSIAIMNLPNHVVWSRIIQKNVMQEEKEEDNTRRCLGSIYKCRAPLTFSNLLKAHRLGPERLQKCSGDYDSEYCSNTIAEYGRDEHPLCFCHENGGHNPNQDGVRGSYGGWEARRHQVHGSWPPQS